MDTTYIARLPLPARLGPYEAHKRVYAAVAERPVYRRVGDIAFVVYKGRIGVDAETKPYSPQVKENDQFYFSLYADVSRSRSGGSARGVRYDPILDVRNANRQRPYSEIAHEIGLEWLEQQGRKHGFRIEDLDLADYQPLQFVRPQNRNLVRLPAVDFHGRLVATDASAFTRMLVSGLGRGKAYGLGLMLVRRA